MKKVLNYLGALFFLSGTTANKSSATNKLASSAGFGGIFELWRAAKFFLYLIDLVKADGWLLYLTEFTHFGGSC